MFRSVGNQELSEANFRAFNDCENHVFVVDGGAPGHSADPEGTLVCANFQDGVPIIAEPLVVHPVTEARRSLADRLGCASCHRVDFCKEIQREIDDYGVVVSEEIHFIPPADENGSIAV